MKLLSDVVSLCALAHIHTLTLRSECKATHMPLSPLGCSYIIRTHTGARTHELHKEYRKKVHATPQRRLCAHCALIYRIHVLHKHVCAVCSPLTLLQFGSRVAAELFTFNSSSTFLIFALCPSRSLLLLIPFTRPSPLMW